MEAITSLSFAVALLALIVPLAALAWSAWQYVDLRKREDASRRFENVRELMDLIGSGPDTSIYTKVAAVHELRHYKDYHELIESLLANTRDRIDGQLAFLLEDEIDRTLLVIRSKP